jgi:pimeloyl-ACP methyl ester carboxylesterase
MSCMTSKGTPEPPIDLAESAAGEEDPGAAIELSMGTGAPGLSDQPAGRRRDDRSGPPPPPENDSLPPRQKVETRDGALEYTLAGEGDTTIVLLNGAGMTLAGWQALYPGVERLGRVFAWNRFGVQGSDDPPPLQSGVDVVASLRELLSQAGVEPPYVLVGHSLGGLYANLFARLHPRDVAGVLFLEATHPRDGETLPQDEAKLTRGLSKVQGQPPEQFEANLHAELEAAGETVQEVEAAGAFPRIPIAVITGGIDPPTSLLSPDAAQARSAHQLALARLSPDSEHVVAEGSGHFPQRSEPQLVLDVLERLLQRVRAARA